MLYFFHGLESGPYGQKYQLLKKHYPELESPDFQGMDLAARIAHAEILTREQRGITLVGSSFGGLLAACMYSMYPERFKSLVLLAPALHTEVSERVEILPAAENIRVMHGRDDEVVPFDKVTQFFTRFHIPVIAVDDQHRLASAWSQQMILRCVADVYPDTL